MDTTQSGRNLHKVRGISRLEGGKDVPSHPAQANPSPCHNPDTYLNALAGLLCVS